MKFFSVDSPFHRIGTLVFDFLALSSLWVLIVLLSFGIFIGPATTAAFSAFYHRFLLDDGEMFGLFFKKFKKRFFHSLVVGILISVFVGINMLNVFFIMSGMVNATIILPFSFALIFEGLLFMAYVYPILAESDKNLKDSIVTAFVLANRHLLFSVLMVINILFVLAVFVFFFLTMHIGVFLLFIIVSGNIFILNGFLFKRFIFPKYNFN
jgi:uncharacterized membrane protein YesL